MCSLTSWRAQYMSVPSSNTMVTTEMPYLEIERTSVVLGIPAIARSTGMLTYCSTSVGARAGDVVMTCTWTLVTSGTASMGKVNAARAPKRQSNAAPSRTTALFRSEKATTAESSPTSLLLAEGPAQDGALQGERPLDDDFFVLAQTGDYFDHSYGRFSEPDVVQLEIAVRMPHEHDRLAGDLDERAARHDEPRFAAGAALGDAGGAEEPDAQQARVVYEPDARDERARRGV